MALLETAVRLPRWAAALSSYVENWAAVAVDAADDEFWEQFWSDSVNSVQVNRELIYTRS